MTWLALLCVLSVGLPYDKCLVYVEPDFDLSPPLEALVFCDSSRFLLAPHSLTMPIITPQ